MSYQYTNELVAEADLLTFSQMYSNKNVILLLVQAVGQDTTYITQNQMTNNKVIAMARNGVLFKPN